MAIEVYQGNFVSAENASKYIDQATINDGCRMLNEASEKLALIAKKISLLRELCSKDALNIQGQTLEEKIETYEEDTNNFSVYLSELSEYLLNATQKVVNRKQVILNEEAKAIDDKKSYLTEEII